MPTSSYGMDAKTSLALKQDFLHGKRSLRRMQTWYLIFGIRLNERPSIIKRCQAEHKDAAARLFAARLNTIAQGQVFTDRELLNAIKREDELTETEQQWVTAEDPKLLEG